MSDFKSAAVFEGLKTLIKGNPDLVQQVAGIYLFNITNAAGKQESWLVDVKTGTKDPVKQGKGQADCTITVADDDFVGMMGGSLNPQQLFMQGKLKIAGNMGLAMKLSKLNAPKAKL